MPQLDIPRTDRLCYHPRKVLIRLQYTKESKEIFLETVVPFRAWRYSSRAGKLSDLVAPPYDVIGPKLQSQLYARSPYNVVRVDLGVARPGDSQADNRYTRAAALLARWKESGILIRDPHPAVTFVEESFVGPDGRPGVRHGFLALMRLYEFGEGVVFPHECTFSGPKEDRYRLMEATAMSLSPVFLLYDLPGDEITAAWKTRLSSAAPAAAVTDAEETTTRLWPTSDPTLLEIVTRSLSGGRFIIADGHHRYETALRYRRKRREETRSGRTGPQTSHIPGGSRPAARPAYEYALAYFANMADPGLAIYATHRLVHGVDPKRVRTLPNRLAKTFAVERLDSMDPRGSVWKFLQEHPRRAFGLWGATLDAPYGLHLADVARARETAPGHLPAYQELDVTILQALVLEQALGISSEDLVAERYVTYCKDPQEAFIRLAAGEFQVGFFMNPPGLDQIKEVAFSGERLPPKATFFHPKLPTGLVFHDLSGEV